VAAHDRMGNMADIQQVSSVPESCVYNYYESIYFP